MENAGCTAGRGGGETGVFVGLTEQDYKHNKLCSVEDLDLSAVSGSSGAQASGRLAYHLGLHGPCLTIDTACSSSLAAVHLAVNSLRLGECQMALAGGVTLQYSPAVNIASNQTKTLSAEGRCKPFADDADGIVWSDGCAVVVLKLYDQAVRDRDNIMAVIAGSAINQDGRANGLSSPTAQEVMQRALRLSGLKANDLGYVEAFGSGIRMADAIEAQAIGALAGDSRPSKPTYVGSIKSNFGHCMAASGVASLAKVVLSLQHQAVPVNLHCLEANSLVEWDKLGLKVATQKLSWPASDKLRVAAVNSFGNSGTNVSVVLCDRPGSAGAVSGVEAPEAVVVGLSARSRQALRSAAQRLGDYCQVAEDLSVSDVSFTSLAGRRVFEHRLAVVCSSQKELVEALQAYLSGTDSAACFTAVVQRQDQLVAEPMGWSAVQVVGYYLSAPAQAVESWTAKCPYGRIVPLPGQLNN